MRLVTALALLAGIVLITGNGLFSQEKKDTPGKVKGQLPANWGKLDLTPDQKQSIYKVQAKYKEDIAKMKEKIKEIESEERAEMSKLLTPEQKKKLQELATGEKSDPKKETPKKDAPKEKPKDSPEKPKDSPEKPKDK